jgi:transcription elongation factor GreA
MTQKVPMTLGSHKLLEEELKHLKFFKRPTISKAIETAREHGDLKENAEYHAAKEQQGLCEARVKDLEYKVSCCEIIDPAKLSGDRVLFSATVTLADEDDEEVTYQIVGIDEADIKFGKVSFSSPIGRAMIGKNIGDDVEVQTPKGKVYYEVMKVEFI